MKSVIQDETINLDITFYNIEPAGGGVPTDPDHYLHTWDITDPGAYVSAITLLEGGLWPTQPDYYFSIIDSGTDFEVKGYSDALRTVEVVSTGTLSYGVFVDQALNEVGGSGLAGTISLTFSGIGGGTEDFQIDDIGQTEPTYQIFDQDNTEVVAETVCTDRDSEGKYHVDYDVADDAPPGENWKIVWRGTINKVDSFFPEYFRVIDAAVAEEENAMIITLSELKNGMKKTGDTEDQFLTGLLLAASQTIEEYTGQNYHVDSKTILLSGNGRPKMHIEDDGPIKAILSVRYLTGDTWTTSTHTIDFDGWFIFNRGSVFPSGMRNIELQYEYGNDKAPRNIRQAVIQLVKYWYAYQNRTGVVSDVVGGGLRVNYEELKDDLPAEVKTLIRPYRRIV